jgi:hypothetical protein
MCSRATVILVAWLLHGKYQISHGRIVIDHGGQAFVNNHFAGYAPETIRQLLAALRASAEYQDLVTPFPIPTHASA